MQIPKMIKLTEITKEADAFKEKPVLLNVEGIVSVQDSELEAGKTVGGIPIVGKGAAPLSVRIVMMITGHRVCVKETLDLIALDIANAAEGALRLAESKLAA